MPKPSAAAIQHFCEELNLDPQLVMVCLEEATISVADAEGPFALNGTLLHLRRVERICHTFDVDVHVAVLLARIR